MKRLDKAHKMANMVKEAHRLENEFLTLRKETHVLETELESTTKEIDRLNEKMNLIGLKKAELFYYERETAEALNHLTEVLKELKKEAIGKQSQEEKISAKFSKKKEEIQTIWDNATRIHIHSLKISQSKDIPAYDHYYYIPELDTHQILCSNSSESLFSNTIDFRDFFKDYGFPTEGKYINNRVGVGSKNILRTIINDLFSKKDYSSWEEVIEDIKTIPQIYPRPLEFESASKYSERININHKRRQM